MSGTHPILTDPADIHEEKHALAAAAGTLLQFQGDGTGSAVPAHVGQEAITVSSLALTLTAIQASRAYLKFSSVLTGAIVVTMPSGTFGPVFIENQCTLASSFTIRTVAGTGVTVTASKRKAVIGDGVNAVSITPEV
jgi:hypothetical protein